MRLRYVFFLFLVFSNFGARAQDCPEICEVYIPNNVTPDGDDINAHYLEIQSDCSIKKFEFIVFNNWGEEVFKSKDPDIKFSSKDVDEAVYLWQLKGTFCNGEKLEKRGYVTVLK